MSSSTPPQLGHIRRKVVLISNRYSKYSNTHHAGHRDADFGFIRRQRCCDNALNKLCHPSFRAGSVLGQADRFRIPNHSGAVQRQTKGGKQYRVVAAMSDD